MTDRKKQFDTYDANHLRKPPHTHSGNLARLPAALAPLTEQRRWVCWQWILAPKGRR